MLKALIIDDEKSGREILINLLKMFCRNVEVVGEADSVASGIKAISEHQPDLIFLDVQMQDGTGFDLLEKSTRKDIRVIFVTAFQEFAIKAFQFSAIDYILKPVSAERLVLAVNKVLDIAEKDELSTRINTLLQNTSANSEPKKIILKTTERIYAVEYKDIIRCESDDSYTRFYLADGKKIMVSRQLKEFEEMLSTSGFFRTHQSHLINVKYFDYFDKAGDLIFMKDGSKVPVATRKKDALLKMISDL